MYSFLKLAETVLDQELERQLAMERLNWLKCKI